MVPVVVIQDGCAVTLVVGVAGAPGGAFTIKEVPAETHNVDVFLTVTE
jgi:hypothetical protein